MCDPGRSGFAQRSLRLRAVRDGDRAQARRLCHLDVVVSVADDRAAGGREPQALESLEREVRRGLRIGHAGVAQDNFEVRAQAGAVDGVVGALLPFAGDHREAHADLPELPQAFVYAGLDQLSESERDLGAPWEAVELDGL